MNKIINILKKILIIAFICFACWDVFISGFVERPYKEHDAKDIELSDDLKERINEDIKNTDDIDVTTYSLKLTDELLTFNRTNDIKNGRANCIGYSMLCSSICNYAFSVNGDPGRAHVLVGHVYWYGINLHELFMPLIPKEYQAFCKDHHYVEVTNGFYNTCDCYSFDPTFYDLLGWEFSDLYPY